MGHDQTPRTGIPPPGLQWTSDHGYLPRLQVAVPIISNTSLRPSGPRAGPSPSSAVPKNRRLSKDLLQHKVLPSMSSSLLDSGYRPGGPEPSRLSPNPCRYPRNPQQNKNLWYQQYSGSSGLGQGELAWSPPLTHLLPTRTASSSWEESTHSVPPAVPSILSTPTPSEGSESSP